MVKKCKPGFSKKGNKCVKNNSNGLFRVAWEVPTSRGFEKQDIKVFHSLPGANKEFKKRLTEFKKDIKKNDFEGGEGLIMEDVMKDIRVESRIVDEDGELQNYGGMS